jgi:flagellin-specific chaperone FliS
MNREMNSEMISGYRATMFDGEADLDWLRQGWRGLRVYARLAQMALHSGDVPRKAELLARADGLLTLLTGILDTGAGTTLGPALHRIYNQLQVTLLRANAGGDAAALDDFAQAVDRLGREMLENSHGAAA